MRLDSSPAEFWPRAVASLVDGIIIYLQTILVTWVLYRWGRLPLPAPQALRLWDIAIVAAVMVLGAWLYFALTESSSKQASLGKRLFRLRVVDLQGRRIPFHKATYRFWLKILSLGLLIIPFLNQTVSYDSRTGTLVIHQKASRSLRAPTCSSS